MVSFYDIKNSGYLLISVNPLQGRKYLLHVTVVLSYNEIQPFPFRFLLSVHTNNSRTKGVCVCYLQHVSAISDLCKW